MKRARVLETLGLVGALCLGTEGRPLDASPLRSHRTTETAGTIGLRSRSAIPRPWDPTAGEAGRPLDVGIDFDPGISAALKPPLPPPLSGDRKRPTVNPSVLDDPRRRDAMTRVPRRQAVPEPASIVLVVTGLIGLAARRHLLRNRR